MTEIMSGLPHTNLWLNLGMTGLMDLIGTGDSADFIPSTLTLSSFEPAGGQEQQDHDNLGLGLIDSRFDLARHLGQCQQKQHQHQQPKHQQHEHQQQQQRRRQQRDMIGGGNNSTGSCIDGATGADTAAGIGASAGGSTSGGAGAGSSGQSGGEGAAVAATATATTAGVADRDLAEYFQRQPQQAANNQHHRHPQHQLPQRVFSQDDCEPRIAIKNEDDCHQVPQPLHTVVGAAAASGVDHQVTLPDWCYNRQGSSPDHAHRSHQYQYEHQQQQQQLRRDPHRRSRNDSDPPPPPSLISLEQQQPRQQERPVSHQQRQQQQEQQHSSTDNPSPADASLFTPPSSSTLTAIAANTTAVAGAAVGPSLSSFSLGSQSQLQSQSQYYHHLAAHQRQRQQQQQQRQQRQYHYPHQQRNRYRHQFHSIGLDGNGGSDGSAGPAEIGAAIVKRASDSDSAPAPVSASVPLGRDEGSGGGGSGGGGSGECVRGAAVAVGQPRAAGSISVSNFGVDLGVGVGVDDCAGGTRFDNGIGIFPGELLHGVAAVAAAAADHHHLKDLQNHLHNQYRDHNQDQRQQQQQQQHYYHHHHQFDPVTTASAASQSSAGRSLAAIMAITQLASSTSSSAQSPSQPPPRHDQSDQTGPGSESLVLAPLPEPVRQQQHPLPHPQQQPQQHPQSAPHQDHQPAPQQHQQHQQQQQQRHASPPILNQITPALATASSATSIAAAAAAVATPTLSVASLIIPHPDRRSPVFPSAALHPVLAPLPGTVPIAPHTPTTATISPDVLVRNAIDSRHREHDQEQQDQQQQQQQQAAEKKGHQRVYQACIPCRRRKVRCDLGSVDNPSDPPCQRCLRESKDCYFSATRRKRKNEEGDGGASDEIDEYIIRNGRKRVNQSGSPLDRKMFSEIPLTPGGTAGRTQPLRRPTDESGCGSGSGTRPGDLGSDESNNTQLENLEAQTVMRREVYGPHDALDLLYKAATDSPTANHKRSSSSTTISQPLQPPQLPPPPPQLQQPQPPGHHHPQPHHQHQRQHSHQHQHQNQNQSVPHPAAAIQRKPSATDGQPDSRPVKAEPAMADPGLRFRSVGASSATTTAHEYHPDAIKAWSRFRFVRAGWFTAQEAIEYIKYYYVYLSPLTPISPPTFQDEASHITLLTEEPVLTVTLLTIASRYRELPGTGGHCRSLSIHEKLWSYLHRMIERCFWGQEDFGGVMPAGPSGEDCQGGSTAPSRGLKKGSLRTLGTIESLLILTEWHPRALYFPPDDAIYELMLPSPGYGDPEPFEDAAAAATAAAGGGGGGAPRLENWLEPAWRSDRMCWMLLSTAMGLAYELGVYDDVEELLRDGAILRPEYEEEAYRQRAHRVKRLLTIYITQLAGRLGWTNMAPAKFWQTVPAAAASAAAAAEVATGAHGRRRPVSHEGGTPLTALSTLSVGFNYIPDLELDDQIIHCWAGISSAMNLGNQKLFKSHKHTTEIIQSGRYIDLLREFQPMLRDWWKEFERFRLPLYIRHILTIEFEYVRIYINSLSLQAVVERCTNNAGSGSGGGGTTAADSAAQLSPQTRKYFGKLPLGQLGGFSAADKQYVREVIDGCRNLLRTVVDGLLPRGYLKHAPIRTYLRIINGAIFLLKTFTLGAARADVKISIDLMDKTVEALRNCVVDDVHIGIRFADLLESLTSRLRNRFIQAPPMSAAMAMAATGPGSDMGDVNSPLPNHSDVVMGNGVGQAGNRDWGGKVGEDFYAADRQSTPGISATPFDLRAGNFPYQSGIAATLNPSSSTPANLDQHPHSHNHSLLHPNQHNVNHGGPAGTGGAGLMLDSWDNPGEMWYLPPGPAFFQNMENNAVSMTAEGVNVGGIDLLDYIVMEPQGYGADSY